MITQNRQLPPVLVGRRILCPQVLVEHLLSKFLAHRLKSLCGWKSVEGASAGGSSGRGSSMAESNKSTLPSTVFCACRKGKSGWKTGVSGQNISDTGQTGMSPGSSIGMIGARFFLPRSFVTLGFLADGWHASSRRRLVSGAANRTFSKVGAFLPYMGAGAIGTY